MKTTIYCVFWVKIKWMTISENSVWSGRYPLKMRSKGRQKRRRAAFGVKNGQKWRLSPIWGRE